MTVRTTFLVIKLMEKALVRPYWPVVMPITPNFPVKKDPFTVMMKSKGIFPFLFVLERFIYVIEVF